MDRIDMSLDDIIKDNKKKSKQATKGNNANGNSTKTSNGNNLNNNNKSKTGPIRARSAGKKLTRQKASPYPGNAGKYKLISMVDKWPKPKESAVLSEEYGETFCYGLLILPGGPKSLKTGNPNGVWRHDLFSSLNPGGQTKRPAQTNNGLSIQHRLGTGKTSPGNGVANRLSIKGVAGGKQTEFSIKGEGGPATIYINNLAPGTSANDVKTAFLEFGDISTVNIKDDKITRGAISAELTFSSKPSAIAAINKYNTALVDGRVLKVQLKQAGTNNNLGAASYRLRNKPNKTQFSTQNGKLYSDHLTGNSGQKNRGKGKQPSFSGVSF
ncbi:58_t:CDS:2 [Rhizophagus irregularis]|nr:58_t:CDS:2 [Rhizophagus irregularis]